VEWVEEPSYFFRLSAYQDKLLAFYEANPDFVAPEKSRFKEVKSFVKGGLLDLSVSRASFSWGVPVPDDEDHVMYVWLDALTNYMTAAGYGQEGGEAEYKKRWPADLHVVGKDILRFHAVYWPAFLMAAGLPLPKRVFAHGWWTIEGRKISKSLGNAIDPLDIADKYGLDQMRYFLLREIPFGNDGDFSHQAMVRRMNDDLANDLGNLCQRVLSMIVKNCSGVMPSPPAALSDADNVILSRLDGLLEGQRKHYDHQQFDKALKDIWEVVADANRYVDEMAPWTLRKTDPGRMADVLWVLAEILRQTAILIQPVMPEAARNILNQLGVGEKGRGFGDLGAGGRLAGGQSVEDPIPVFPRYIEEEGIS
jgi:methionyl-tRNA synthetase